MKKLMIAAAIVCAAAMSHGAAANWTGAASNIYNGTGSATTADKYAGAVYFFNADAVAQKAIFEAFAKDTAKFDITKQTGYLATGIVESGTIKNGTAANKFSAFEQGSGDHSFFFVLINDDKMYTSMTKAEVPAGGTDDAVNIAFGNQKTTSMPNSSLAATEGWGGAGVWSAAAVPEPTSGLLLLLGVAGLALRRRRV